MSQYQVMETEAGNLKVRPILEDAPVTGDFWMLVKPAESAFGLDFLDWQKKGEGFHSINDITQRDKNGIRILD